MATDLVLNESTSEITNYSSSTSPNGSIVSIITEGYDNIYATHLRVNETCTSSGELCKEGLLIPMWLPQHDLTMDDRHFRAFFYILSLVYVFLGIAVVTERFMAAIEVIISHKKVVEVSMTDGSTITVTERIWSETVADLTLVTVGSSASVILLSIVEVCGNGFQVGDLGPSTAIGSAAYNLFIICAICVFVVPNNKVQKIKKLRVFVVTTAWSIFAYIWLFIILGVISKGVVEVWEAVVTCGFFPATVYTAFIAERGVLRRDYMDRQSTLIYEASRESHISPSVGQSTDLKKKKSLKENDQLLQTAMRRRNEIALIMRRLREIHPDLDLKILTAMAKSEIVNKEPKSKAFYASKGTRNNWYGVSKETENYASIINDLSKQTKLFFDSDIYAVRESSRTVRLTVLRRGGDISKTCFVDYYTQEGTAKEVLDYVKAEGTLAFKPNQVRAHINIEIISDDVVEDEEYFYVNLSNPWIGDAKGDTSSAKMSKTAIEDPSTSSEVKKGDAGLRKVAFADARNDGVFRRPSTSIDLFSVDIFLDHPYVATVTIVDDSHPGIFYFPNSTITVQEDCGDIPVKVCRAKGGNGRIRLYYHSLDGTAERGQHYEIFGDSLVFENQEHEKSIMVRIYNKDQYKVKQFFYLTLEEPVIEDEPLYKKRVSRQLANPQEQVDGQDTVAPALGDQSRITIHIRESKTFKNAVDHVLTMQKVVHLEGATTWWQQFNNALSVNPEVNYLPADCEYINVDIKLPSFMEYVIHFSTLTWKMVAAMVPPTNYCHGWPSFFACFAELGFLTIIIGDLATALGCTVGLKDSFTAISFVAIGVSLPDTFSSKLAAISDGDADAAIGNVPTCNAANVFLGLGIAWTMASVHHGTRGQTFLVPNESLVLMAITFSILSFLASCLLLARRREAIGGELGGPQPQRLMSSLALIALWVLFLVISTLVIYCYLQIS
ncbi:hypothetical protein BsWGS_15440 [Bradybaena similaris]